MNEFARLFDALDQTTSTLAKVAAMVGYFARARSEDAAWAAYFLCGRKPKRIVTSTQLREWVTEVASLPDSPSRPVPS